MEIVLAMIAAGAMCCLSFVIGAKVGQKVSKGEEVKLPSVNLLDIARKHEAKREAQREQDRIDTIMRNIEGYDGTGNNQEDVPGR